MGTNDLGGTVQNCYATGNVFGAIVSNAGGVVGQNLAGSTVEYCYATGEVSGWSNVGGVVGFNAATVTNCVALNQAITDTSPNTSYLSAPFGRVDGSVATIGLLNNRARDDMGWNGAVGTPLTNPFTLNSKNGETITIPPSGGPTPMDTVFSDWDREFWNIPGGVILDKGNPLPTLRDVGGPQDPKLP